MNILPERNRCPCLTHDVGLGLYTGFTHLPHPDRSRREAQGCPAGDVGDDGDFARVPGDRDVLRGSYVTTDQRQTPLPKIIT